MIPGLHDRYRFQVWKHEHRNAQLQTVSKYGHPESYDLHKEDYDPDSLRCIRGGSGPRHWLKLPYLS